MTPTQTHGKMRVKTAHSAATSFVGFLSLGAALRLPRPTTSSFPLCQRAIAMPHTSPT